MNKLIFFIVYLPVGVFLLVFLGPYLRYKKYLKDKVIASSWLNKKPIKKDAKLTCNFCDSAQMCEEVVFKIPKAVNRTIFSYAESSDSLKYISVRCRCCQSEIGRKSE